MSNPFERKPTVLFLCTGNSCRSQMAEGFLRAWASDRFDVHSAGLEPKAAIHPLAIQVMREVGIDLSNYSPKGVTLYLGKVAVNYAVFVCERAESKCPYLWPGSERIFWPFEDPAAFVGSDVQTIDKFREVRDKIGARIQKWLAE